MMSNRQIDEGRRRDFFLTQAARSTIAIFIRISGKTFFISSHTAQEYFASV